MTNTSLCLFTHAQLKMIAEAVEEMRPLIEGRNEIERLKAEVDLWKDRCMAAEQAHDATVEHYEKLLNRDW